MKKRTLKKIFKYLESQIKKRITSKQRINHMAIKLNKANAMMSKLGQVFDIKSLKSVYYAIYLSPMYAMLVLHEHQKLIGLKDFIYYKKPPSV